MKFGKWQTYFGIGMAHCCWISLSIEFLHWSSIHPNINQISALIKLQKKQKIWFQARLVCKQVGGWLQQKQGCGSRLVLQGLVLRPPPPPPPPPAPPAAPGRSIPGRRKGLPPPLPARKPWYTLTLWFLLQQCFVRIEALLSTGTAQKAHFKHVCPRAPL